MCTLIARHMMALTHIQEYRCDDTHVSSDALEGERYKLGVELVGSHAVDEEGEVFQ